MGEGFELAVAGLDLGIGETLKPAEREGLHRKGSHHRAHDDGPAKIHLIEILRAGQKAQEASGKGIPRPRGVADILQRKGRGGKPAPIGEAERSVFPSLDHQRARAPRQNRLGRPDYVRLLGQHPRLGIIDDEDLDVFESLPECLGFPLNPEVHGVSGDQAGGHDLGQDLPLQVRIDVRQEDHLSIPVGFGQSGMEFCKDIELGLERLRLAEVKAILPLPPEGPTGPPLHPGEIDLPRSQKLQVVRPEVLSHHRHHADGGKEAGGRRKVGRRASEDFRGLAEGSLDRIEGHRAHNQNLHLLSSILTDAPALDICRPRARASSWRPLRRRAGR